MYVSLSELQIQEEEDASNRPFTKVMRSWSNRNLFGLRVPFWSTRIFSEFFRVTTSVSGWSYSSCRETSKFLLTPLNNCTKLCFQIYPSTWWDHGKRFTWRNVLNVTSDNRFCSLRNVAWKNASPFAFSLSTKASFTIMLVTTTVVSHRKTADSTKESSVGWEKRQKWNSVIMLSAMFSQCSV